jgi:hypothetical protein
MDMSKRNEDSEPVEEVTDEQLADLFVADTGRSRKGASISIEKFQELLVKAEAAMESIGSNAVAISLPKLNSLLGTSYHNNNSLAYALKTGKSTAPVLKEHNLYVGGKGLWSGPVADQSLRFVKTSK